VLPYICMENPTNITAPHPSLLLRKIIHVDMDAFYASVEVRDNPKLAGLPIVIGGPPNSRSVVCTASYAARAYGIRSAMACSMAHRLCPAAIFIPPNFEKYTDVARALREIFSRYSALVEPLSLDEAYLDVTNNSEGLFAVKIAQAIRETIHRETGLTASAGVAPNKMVAKICSDFHKPNGITVVQPHQVADFMAPLPLRKIPGVGPVTEKHFLSKGLAKCSSVLERTEEELALLIGNRAPWIYAAARGIDTSPVETGWERRSLGEEETFPVDLTQLSEMNLVLRRLSESVHQSLSDSGYKGRTVQLKVKYSDFKTVTRQRSFAEVIGGADHIFSTVVDLLGVTDASTRPVRLLGVSISKLDS
jgi:DNA polymerase IV